MNGCQEIADEIQFGERISPQQAEVFKYNLDVDGNGWSSRFHRLLTGGSAVIKMTMFPEWNMETLSRLQRKGAVRSCTADIAVPWLHYIPLKPDYSDLYDIMSFFVGPMDENGKVNTELGHDVSTASGSQVLRHARAYTANARTASREKDRRGGAGVCGAALGVEGNAGLCEFR